MKKILLIFSLLFTFNNVFSQVESPYYDKANEQLIQMIKYFDGLSLPLNETQKANILKINIGVLDKTQGINSSESTDEEKKSNLNNIKLAHEKYILKQLSDPQKEKYKDWITSDSK
ncbi:MAG: hypothetical protein V4622_00865 [Bacteroidota bacterium]